MIDCVVGNTKPDLSFRVRRDNVDISADASISTVAFKLRNPVSATTITIPLSLLGGRWVGNFGVGDLSSDLANRDDVFGELVVTFDDGSVQNGREPIRLRVRPEYAEMLV